MTGTYENQYNLRMLTVDNEHQQMSVVFRVDAALDNGEVLPRPDDSVLIEKEEYAQLFGLPLSALPADVIVKMTLGQLIAGLTSFRVKMNRPDFPQTAEEVSMLGEFAAQVFKRGEE